MSNCCAPPSAKVPHGRYRRVLWVALAINAVMFAAELASGLYAHSTSLLADAVDFFGDTANYALSLFVIGLAPVWGSRAALVKAAAMAGFGIFVLVRVALQFGSSVVPDAPTMGVVGTLALCANLACAALLYAFREGDANMRSVWLCTRNDAIGNVAVLLAALGTWGMAAGWPDLLVATGMAILALRAAWSVVGHARAELAVPLDDACRTGAKNS
jgi:Co/Zn/Cd efflux system component